MMTPERRAAYEASKRVPATDKELRTWLLDVESGGIRTMEPHVEQRMQRIFSRLRELDSGIAELVDVIELYIGYRVGRLS